MDEKQIYGIGICDKCGDRFGYLMAPGEVVQGQDCRYGFKGPFLGGEFVSDPDEKGTRWVLEPLEPGQVKRHRECGGCRMARRIAEEWIKSVGKEMAQ